MDQSIISCPSCSIELSAKSRFCPSCGQSLAALSQMPTVAAPELRTPQAPVGRLALSGSIPAGGFTPGSILAERYRIIGLLGRGGMGEVYRADDLKLGQAVALKFLPRAFGSDPVHRERFFSEVRITRQLSHPNICRVYDIAEFEGQHFLSMEFVDGEDLASLIKRIGYLPNEKATDIARQLAAGLAAAHERGVLHRDLKPANIMIDGHGRVRITDFGLAIAAADQTQASDVSGTPAYMAPEQLAGKGATVRSDIYSLGLVLYEIYCGKKAFDASSMAELREQKETHTLVTPSQVRPSLDPIVERLILRCLEHDPQLRPASAAQLAAALPGGDPLAAALAAGETPSPEMVAASGLKEGFRPAVAVALLAVVVVGSIAAFALTPRIFLIERAGAGKPPAFLVERAREIIRQAGYIDDPADGAFGYDYYSDFFDYIRSRDRTANRWDNLKEFTSVVFWYRQSPRTLQRNSFTVGLGGGTITFSDPPMSASGEVRIRLDPEGRLRTFEAIPAEVDSGTAVPGADWRAIFAAAGFDFSKWGSVTPQRLPLFYADTRAAWQGTLQDRSQIPVRIEAAAYRGKPVHFEIVGPWTRASRVTTAAVPAGQKIANAIMVMLLAVLLGGGVFFAHRNLRLGRGDRRGATRLALVVFGAMTLSWLLREHHVADVWEVILLVAFLGEALFMTVMAWVLYVALEPFARRRWPQILIAWTRVLAGDWRDPLVGRDVLIGCAAGIVLFGLTCLDLRAPSWFGYPEAMPATPRISAFSGLAPFVSHTIELVVGDVVSSFGILFLLFFLRVIFRNQWLASAAFVAIMSAVETLQSDVAWIEAIVTVLFMSLLLYLLIRFGLIAFITGSIVGDLFANYPMTLRSSAWYAGAGFGALAIVGALTFLGFRVSLGGRRILDMTRVET